LKVEIRSPLISKLISYPKFDADEYGKRITDLEKMGIKDVILEGFTQLYELKILGKGHSGVVLKVNTYSGKNFALKIRRLDSRRKDCLIEVKNQKLANLVGIGPKILENTHDLVLMEFINGKGISDWFVDHSNLTDFNKKNVVHIVNEILEQCYTLDNLNLDHGELTRIDNHIMISDKNQISIIDFESSSTKRKPSNVTSVTQALFLSGSVSKKISQCIKIKNYDLLLKQLRNYKKVRTRLHFDNILSEVIGKR
jgi:putative serine/threonine protein kinase